MKIVVIAAVLFSHVIFANSSCSDCGSNGISFEGCKEQERPLPGPVKNLSMKFTKLKRSLDIGKEMNSALMIRNEENQRNTERNVMKKDEEMAKHSEEIEPRKRRKEYLCSDEEQKEITKKMRKSELLKRKRMNYLKRQEESEIQRNSRELLEALPTICRLLQEDMANEQANFIPQ